jgi:hypothetical protein
MKRIVCGGKSFGGSVNCLVISVNGNGFPGWIKTAPRAATRDLVPVAGDLVPHVRAHVPVARDVVPRLRARLPVARNLVPVGRAHVPVAQKLVPVARAQVPVVRKLVPAVRAQVPEGRAPPPAAHPAGFSRAGRLAGRGKRFNRTRICLATDGAPIDTDSGFRLQIRAHPALFAALIIRGSIQSAHRCASVCIRGSIRSRGWPILGDMQPQATNSTSSGQVDPAKPQAADAWPPPGWVTNREAARRLGVKLVTLTLHAWKWRARLREVARCVRMPGGGRCNIYPAEAIDRIVAEREASAQRDIPEGFVDKDGACAMFGVTRQVWKTWIRQGKIGFGQIIFTPSGHRYRVYAVADLERLREELFGEDKLYKSADNQWHVPPGYMRRDEAWERFGVHKVTWERWEREGTITCGTRVPGGPKLYKVEDIHRMLDEYGTYCPPYLDPDRPGCMRVPLNGRDIKRREALIDADALPLIAGGSCAWSQTGNWGFVTFTGGEFKSVPLRRIILGVADGAMNVRHANGDALDCRRANLVVRTVKQRVQNKRKVRSVKGQPPTSQFKGVFWETWTKKWRAVIKAEGKNRNLGRFGDQVAAAQAYDEAARKWFGEYAWLNFPDGVDAWLEREGYRSETEQRAAA